MKILLTNKYLSQRTGSETFLHTLAHELRNQGHIVTFFALYGGDFAAQLKKEGFRVWLHPTYTNFLNETVSYKGLHKILNYLFYKLVFVYKKIVGYSYILPYALPDNDFDLIHLHHQSVIKTIYKDIKHIPKIHCMHGYLPTEEHPLDQKKYSMDAYIAVSEEVKNFIKKTINKHVFIVRNPINLDKYNVIENGTAGKSTHSKKLLIISKNIASYKYKNMLNTILQASKNQGYETTIIGHHSLVVNDTRPYIQQADIVVGIGRCAYEAMAMGKNVIVCDYLGLEGIVDSEETFLEMRKYNLSGRLRNNIHFSVQEFENEIKKYHLNNGILSRKLIEKYNAGQVIFSQIISIYNQAIRSCPIELPSSPPSSAPIML